MPYLTKVLYNPDDKDNTLTRTGKRFGTSVTGLWALIECPRLMFI